MYGHEASIALQAEPTPPPEHPCPVDGNTLPRPHLAAPGNTAIACRTLATIEILDHSLRSQPLSPCTRLRPLDSLAVRRYIEQAAGSAPGQPYRDRERAQLPFPCRWLIRPGFPPQHPSFLSASWAFSDSDILHWCKPVSCPWSKVSRSQTFMCEPRKALLHIPGPFLPTSVPSLPSSEFAVCA